MFKSHLKIVFRNFLRNKTFSTINLLGLVTGLVTCLAIVVYVADEFSYDRFHANASRIYRTVIEATWDGQTVRRGAVPNKYAPFIAPKVPEIEKAARVFHHNFGDIAFVSTADEKLSERNLFFADPEALDIFTIEFVKGNREKSLDRPNAVILSERSARKYFGDADPVGKTISVDNRYTFDVTGVYKDFPSNSFLQCELIASFSSHRFSDEENLNWGNASFDTYFLLHPDADPVRVEQKIGEALSGEEVWFKAILQPMLDIRLHSNELTSESDGKSYGDLQQVKILIALALVVLLIAAINYMNLATAQSQKRNKEVGISKTLGATFGQLSVKFYFEAAFFVALSLLLSIALFSLLLPFFNILTGKVFDTNVFTEPWFIAGCFLIWISLSVIAGVYPAWYLSSFSPKAVLLKTASSRGQASIRRGLVVFQFTTCIVLIVATIMFSRQMNFIRDKKLGYTPQQVVAVMVSAAKGGAEVSALKKKYEGMSAVRSVSYSQSYPGVSTSSRTLMREGIEGKGASIMTTRSTHEILDVLNIRLIAGKTLPETKHDEDTTVQVVINKATADYLGFSPEEAVGRKIYIQGLDPQCEVVGVAEDFHAASVHQKIGPYCFHNAPTERNTYLLVNVEAAELSRAVTQLEEEFKTVISSAFEFTFLDEKIASLYDSETRLSNLVLIFSAMAIFIASLGLYALAAYTAEQRLKEIGIRKVLGAPVRGIVALLSKDYLLLVAAGIAIGIPLGYFAVEKWLQGFAYRTDFSIYVFLTAAVVALSIAGLTVLSQSLRAARTNPVDTLKSE